MAVQQPRSKTKLKLLLAFLFCVVILTMLNFITASGGLNFDNNDQEERPLLIIAVPSVDDHFKDRNRLRQLTKHFPQVLCPFCKNKRDLDPQVHLLFFIGKRPISDATQQKIAEEMAQYQDLVFLNITENLNEGKTWAVLNWIYLNTKAHFVMKSDEDSFVNVPALIQRLRHFQQKFPKEYHKLYYGFPWTYDTWEFTSKSAIMVGMGYTMGWDLIEFFSTDQRAWNKTHGAEDVVTHYWLGNRTDVVRIGDRVRFHDPPGHKGPASWSYRCDDVVVHRLKTDELWKEIKEFYFGCCYQILEDPVECRESPKSSSCCGTNSTICDRACVTSLRQLEVVEPFTKYYSDEDLDYLQTPSNNYL